MPNNGMSDDLRFEELVKDFNAPEQFLARQLREVQQECKRREHCYSNVVFSRRQVAGGVSVVGGISAVVAALLEIALRM